MSANDVSKNASYSLHIKLVLLFNEKKDHQQSTIPSHFERHPSKSVELNETSRRATLLRKNNYLNPEEMRSQRTILNIYESS